MANIIQFPASTGFKAPFHQFGDMATLPDSAEILIFTGSRKAKKPVRRQAPPRRAAFKLVFGVDFTSKRAPA